MVAMTGVSASLATSEAEEIEAFCAARSIRWERITTDELAQPGYIENAPDRCYHCKTELYGQVISYLAQHATASEFEGMTVIDGTHAGDLQGHRPGHKAALEKGVRSPFVELQMDKTIIRGLADKLGLENAERPSAPCLSSRIAYGVEVTPERLHKVGEAEAALRALGFSSLRVRLHGEIARIELPKRQLSQALAQADAIVAAVKNAGFVWVTLDLEGLRSGSLLEVLSPSRGEKPA